MVFGTQDHAFFPSIRGRGLTRGVPLAPTVVLLVLLGAGVTEAQPRLSPEAVARALLAGLARQEVLIVPGRAARWASSISAPSRIRGSPSEKSTLLWLQKGGKCRL